MLECLLMVIVSTIVALIVYYVIAEVVKVFWVPPPPVMKLVGLLLGLIVLVQALGCLGILEGGWSFHRFSRCP